MQSVCVLASGGLDSSVVLFEYSKSYDRVFPLFVSCGLRWDRIEQFWLDRFINAIRADSIQPVHVVSIDLGDAHRAHWSVGVQAVPKESDPRDSDYLPARNLLLLTQAALFCQLRGIDAVATGHLQHNPHPDGGDAFFEAFERAASIGLGRPIKVLTPYRRLDKSDVIRRAGGAPLELTFTCLDPRGTDHCGTCQHCFERRKAFREAQVGDPTPYRA